MSYIRELMQKEAARGHEDVSSLICDLDIDLLHAGKLVLLAQETVVEGQGGIDEDALCAMFSALMAALGDMGDKLDRVEKLSRLTSPGAPREPHLRAA